MHITAMIAYISTGIAFFSRLMYGLLAFWFFEASFLIVNSMKHVVMSMIGEAK